MKLMSNRFAALATLAVASVLTLAACGGNKPADQAAAPAAAVPTATEAPAAAPPSAAPTNAPPPAAEVAESRPRPAAKPQPKPAPTPTPRPEPVVKTVAAGTDIDVELIDGASSKTSNVGDTVRARVTKAIVIDGLTVVPAGAVAEGTVTEAIGLMKIGGQASLGLRFDTLDLGDGGRTPIGVQIRQQGKSETGKDAGTIAGATAGGALLGRLLSKHDKTKGTLIGAAVGAAAGTGAAAATKGQEVELPAGTPMALHLEHALEIKVQP